jgi:hypothetical protein
MSIKGCFRKGCENIMCDMYSTQFGYICPECFEELITFPQAGINFVEIRRFMDTDKRDVHVDSRVFNRAFAQGVFRDGEVL